jgi:RNA recognition motif-containing protein
MYPVKAENIPHTASSEKLLDTFKTFGEVGDVYIPVDLKSRKPKKDFAVIRFTDKKAAEDALQLSESSPDKLTQSLGLAATATGGQIRLSPLKKQPSFFTNNTGWSFRCYHICICQYL